MSHQHRRHSLLPRSLFGRALLIIIVPTVLIQIISTYIFYERHWDNVQRHMAESLAGEVAFLTKELADTGYSRRRLMAYDMYHYLGLNITFVDGQQGLGAEATEQTLSEIGALPEEDWLHPLHHALAVKLSYPYRLYFAEEKQQVVIRVMLESGAMEVRASLKRVTSPTTYIYVMWMTGAAVVFLFVAILFLRNQIRPIIRLARAADRFGKGLDAPNFKASGAYEIRKAAHAFQRMQERIRRLIHKRTEMLAAISHDLRTPLTRMKLELAMLKDTAVAEALSGDVQTMEAMIEEYLDFVRGEGTEETEPVMVDTLLAAVVAEYQRHDRPVSLEGTTESTLEARPMALQRCVSNIIDNGLRYGTQVVLHAHMDEEQVVIHIDDDGPGIPEEKRDDMLQAFTRQERSRNEKTGGVGLGLAIAKDIVLSHGGALSLHDSPDGGLRVRIALDV